jgi:hypothetical protein
MVAVVLTLEYRRRLFNSGKSTVLIAPLLVQRLHVVQEVAARIRPARFNFDNFIEITMNKAPQLFGVFFPPRRLQNYADAGDMRPRYVVVMNVSSPPLFVPRIFCETITLRDKQIVC